MGRPILTLSPDIQSRTIITFSFQFLKFMPFFTEIELMFVEIIKTETLGEQKTKQTSQQAHNKYPFKVQSINSNNG